MLRTPSRGLCVRVGPPHTNERRVDGLWPMPRNGALHDLRSNRWMAAQSLQELFRRLCSQMALRLALCMFITIGPVKKL